MTTNVIDFYKKNNGLIDISSDEFYTKCVVLSLRNAEALGVWLYGRLWADGLIDRKAIKIHFGFGEARMKKNLTYLNKVGLIEYRMKKNAHGRYVKGTIHALDGKKYMQIFKQPFNMAVTKNEQIEEL